MEDKVWSIERPIINYCISGDDVCDLKRHVYINEAVTVFKNTQMALRCCLVQLEHKLKRNDCHFAGRKIYAQYKHTEPPLQISAR
jgi:hypothetical protein